MVSTIHVIVVRIIANDDTRVLHHVLDEAEAWNLRIRKSLIGIGSIFYLHKFHFMAFRASPQHSPSKFGSAFGLHLNSDLSFSYCCKDSDSSRYTLNLQLTL